MTMASSIPLIPLSANPTARSLSDPDLRSILQSYFNACNALDFNIIKSYLHPKCVSGYQEREQMRGTSANDVMQGMAMGSVCMAPPFKPYAVIYKVIETPPDMPDPPVRDLHVEFSFHGPDGKEEDVGGRRAKVRYTWKWDGEDGLWKIVAQMAQDAGFDMKKGDWMGEYKEFERVQREKRNWFTE
jgi:hypothetical protein